MYILGLSAYYHDSAAALIKDGKVVAACQEERLSRIKNDSSFPKQSILFCLESTGISAEQIEAIVFYEKPFIKFERLLETYIQFAPKGFASFSKAIPIWLNEKIFQKKMIKENLQQIGFSKQTCDTLLFSEHHQSHAASAFYPSPFSEAIILTMDGVGEWDTTTVYHGKNNSLKKLMEQRFPHSLGLLYSAFTYHCGFKVNSGEYKLMGLAPYGKPLFVEKIKKYIIDIKSDGSFKLNMDYFDFCVGLKMTNRKFNELFENSSRNTEDPVKQIHMDIAASIQQVLEEVVLKICKHLSLKYGIKNICLDGGVALNCVANGKLLQARVFDEIWIQPAAGDSGGSLGSALVAYYDYFKKPRMIDSSDSMSGAYLGPAFTNEEIKRTLIEGNVKFKEIPFPQLLDLVGNLLVEGKTLGWFQGKTEYGPRALGNRSILADPRSTGMQKNLNLKIKFRESFRPFAPAILEEETQNWFNLTTKSPYMLLVAEVLENKRVKLKEPEKELSGIDLLNCRRSEIPAVTHVDYTARVQTVSKSTNPKFYQLIERFNALTGCPILLNTSFNVRGEPIVNSPAEALNGFFATGLEILVLENFLILKSEQTSDHSFKNKVVLD